MDDPPIRHVEAKPPVPTLALWSGRDGIVGVPSARGTPKTRDAEAEVRTTHMGFAVSKKGTRAAVREIVRFLERVERRPAA